MKSVRFLIVAGLLWASAWSYAERLEVRVLYSDGGSLVPIEGTLIDDRDGFRLVVQPPRGEPTVTEIPPSFFNVLRTHRQDPEARFSFSAGDTVRRGRLSEFTFILSADGGLTDIQARGLSPVVAYGGTPQQYLVTEEALWTSLRTAQPARPLSLSSDPTAMDFAIPVYRSGRIPVSLLAMSSEYAYVFPGFASNARFIIFRVPMDLVATFLPTSAPLTASEYHLQANLLAPLWHFSQSYIMAEWLGIQDRYYPHPPQTVPYEFRPEAAAAEKLRLYAAAIAVTDDPPAARSPQPGRYPVNVVRPGNRSNQVVPGELLANINQHTADLVYDGQILSLDENRSELIMPLLTHPERRRWGLVLQTGQINTEVTQLNVLLDREGNLIDLVPIYRHHALPPSREGGAFANRIFPLRESLREPVRYHLPSDWRQQRFQVTLADETFRVTILAHDEESAVLALSADLHGATSEASWRLPLFAYPLHSVERISTRSRSASLIPTRPSDRLLSFLNGFIIEEPTSDQQAQFGVADPVEFLRTRATLHVLSGDCANAIRRVAADWQPNSP